VRASAGGATPGAASSILRCATQGVTQRPARRSNVPVAAPVALLTVRLGRTSASLAAHARPRTHAAPHPQRLSVRRNFTPRLMSRALSCAGARVRPLRRRRRRP
jgi:hypothetical protein